MVVAVNLSDSERELPLMGGDAPRVLFASGTDPDITTTPGAVRLAPETAVVLRV